MNRYIEFANGVKCEYNFFYVSGNDIHMVLDKKTLVEASQILTEADLSTITVMIEGQAAGVYTGYTTIVLLHPEENGVRVGLRREQ